jgi:hypothetical protein
MTRTLAAAAITEIDGQHVRLYEYFTENLPFKN